MQRNSSNEENNDADEENKFVHEEPTVQESKLATAILVLMVLLDSKMDTFGQSLSRIEENADEMERRIDSRKKYKPEKKRKNDLCKKM